LIASRISDAQSYGASSHGTVFCFSDAKHIHPPIYLLQGQRFQKFQQQNAQHCQNKEKIRNLHIFGTAFVCLFPERTRVIAIVIAIHSSSVDAPNVCVGKHHFGIIADHCPKSHLPQGPRPSVFSGVPELARDGLLCVAPLRRAILAIEGDKEGNSIGLAFAPTKGGSRKLLRKGENICSMLHST